MRFGFSGSKDMELKQNQDDKNEKHIGRLILKSPNIKGVY